jgi:hypothetical protein
MKKALTITAAVLVAGIAVMSAITMAWVLAIIFGH